MRIAAAVLRASLVIGAFALPVVAQSILAPASTAPPPSHEVIERPVGGFVMTGISLTPAQTARVRAINARYAAARDSIVGGDEQPVGADPTMRARLVENIDRMIAEERLVLTAAQRARFDRNVAEILARRRELQRPH